MHVEMGEQLTTRGIHTRMKMSTGNGREEIMLLTFRYILNSLSISVSTENINT
jgi:hypothetical protein